MKSLDIEPCTGRRRDARLRDEWGTTPAAQRLPLRLIVPGWYSTYWVPRC